MLHEATKACSRCKQSKPVSSFGRNKKTADGLFVWCRECCNAYRREWTKNNPERHKANKKRERVKHAEKYKEAYREYYAKNKERMNKAGKDNYALRRSYYRERSRQYYQDHKGEYRERTKAYRIAHLVEMRAYGREHYRKHRERYRAQGRAWWSSQKAKVAAIKHRRRARLKSNGGSYTAAEWAAMLEWFGYCCLSCGAMSDLTVDHVIPLALGGANLIANLQPLCRSCNSQKHAHTLDYRDPDVLEGFLASL